MKLAVLEHVTDQGDGAVNEDLFGHAGQMIWMIDGATPVDPSQIDVLSDAYWLAHFLDSRLRKLEPKVRVETLFDLVPALARMIARELDRLGWPAAIVPPACSISICYLAPNVLHCLSVGDVTTVVEDHGNVTTLVNPMFGASETATTRDIDLGTPSSVALQHGAQGIRESRLNNIAGRSGRYVLSSNPNVGAGVRYDAVAVSLDARVLVATDGFTRVVEAYDLYEDYVSLLTASLRSPGIAGIMKELREFEASERSQSRTHFKISDDATAAILAVSQV